MPPENVMREIRRRILRADEMQATRRHVVRCHGMAEWRWLSTTTTQRHGADRSQAAASLREARRMIAANGLTPRVIVAAARSR